MLGISECWHQWILVSDLGIVFSLFSISKSHTDWSIYFFYVFTLAGTKLHLSVLIVWGLYYTFTLCNSSLAPHAPLRGPWGLSDDDRE